MNGVALENNTQFIIAHAHTAADLRLYCSRWATETGTQAKQNGA